MNICPPEPVVLTQTVTRNNFHSWSVRVFSHLPCLVWTNQSFSQVRFVLTKDLNLIPSKKIVGLLQVNCGLVCTAFWQPTPKMTWNRPSTSVITVKLVYRCVNGLHQCRHIRHIPGQSGNTKTIWCIWKSQSETNQTIWNEVNKLGVKIVLGKCVSSLTVHSSTLKCYNGDHLVISVLWVIRHVRWDTKFREVRLLLSIYLLLAPSKYLHLSLILILSRRDMNCPASPRFIYRTRCQPWHESLLHSVLPEISSILLVRAPPPHTHTWKRR